MVAIQILGVEGYDPTRQLRTNVETALRNLGLLLKIEEVHEVDRLLDYEIQGIPALVVGGRVVSQKNVPTVEELEILFRTNLQSLIENKKNMKTILFPTDFSETANNAFIYALNFAKKTGASITTLHVYQLPDISSIHLPHTLLEIYESIDLETFENYRDHVPVLRKIAEENGLNDVPVYHMMEEGETIPTILAAAQKTKADLIIMGTKGATGLKEIFIGTIAGEVLEKASCPVLVVPEKATFDGRIDHIAMTTTFREVEIKALEQVLNVAALFDAQVYCINVDPFQSSNLEPRIEKFKALIGERPNLHCEILKNPDIEEAIAGFLEDHKIDLLAMLTRRRKNFIERLFSFSMTKKMAYHLHTPVLAMPQDTLDPDEPGEA
ncbi:MAG: hypothetical protein D6714_18235 [Bacteroidetes bacterium]|nr:MAG: hypothetical protein D6714_18235 [Bacteroidota bacterium]